MGLIIPLNKSIATSFVKKKLQTIVSFLGNLYLCQKKLTWSIIILELNF